MRREEPRGQSQGPKSHIARSPGFARDGGGLRGSFELSPFNDKDADFDFQQVRRQLNPITPTASSILTKPLDPGAGGDVHTAPAIQSGFMTTSDPGYLAILAWIQNGELQ